MLVQGSSLLKHLEKMNRDGRGRLYLLPFQVKRLKLTDIGVFDRLDVHFERDDVNFVGGMSATGKSTILKAIACCFRMDTEFLRKIGRLGRAGKIEIELHCHGNRISIKLGRRGLANQINNTRCVLLDEPFQWVPNRRRVKLLRQLEQTGKQVIVASTRQAMLEAIHDKHAILLSLDPTDPTRVCERISTTPVYTL